MIYALKKYHKKCKQIFFGFLYLFKNIAFFPKNKVKVTLTLPFIFYRYNNKL